MRKILKRVFGLTAILIPMIDWIGRIQTVASLVPFIKKISVGNHRLWIDLGLLVLGFLFLWWSKDSKTKDADSVSATDWKSLGRDFQNLPGRIRADWHRDTDGRESWELWHPACKSLCILAGTMLVKSPKVLAALPQKVRSESDAMPRWLDFLKERHPIRTEPYYETAPDGQQKIGLIGSIEDVRENSSVACIECAAIEI